MAQSSPSGFVHLPGHLSQSDQLRLVSEVRRIEALAPLYVPSMPNTGRPFSVEMTNCGELGWVSSKSGGYRYQPRHPFAACTWPPIPPTLLDLWQSVASYCADPEACLINWYKPGAKLGLHVDADEQDVAAPVVSVSLGDDAWFRIGGTRRRDPTRRLLLKSGDIIVLGGDARLAYHGIDRIVPDTSAILGKPGRYNLTMRRVNPPQENAAR
ncbi:MAG: alpha-ketoglutarate-dependent dioxygenase AlkB family protein [Hyphomicrobiaceae bacterium]